ncbi:hypothetical protein F3K44_33160 [Bacillus megaterium]|nr:hypothetical protein [Priestia megaterium]
MAVNGQSKDALEYDSYKESGLNVIAIGGNKLSRGLTLEGLTISYYYRGTEYVRILFFTNGTLVWISVVIWIFAEFIRHYRLLRTLNIWQK